MAKVRTRYRCQSCGHEEARWLGRCPQCEAWNSLVEEVAAKRRGGGKSPTRARAAPVAIADAPEVSGEHRLRSGLGELDRVLGGGLVAGSLVLMGGEPGVGKSTLVMHLLDGIARRGHQVLYVSGEESVAQTALRARRVGAGADGLTLLAETQLEAVLAEAARLRPAAVAIDSIQTVHTAELDSVPGSIGQVRECAGRLLDFAKEHDIPTIVVGHVTKEGSIAGPKTLEHVVDAVLQFESEGASPYRIVRALKNRFGSTQEIGVFEMRTEGLRGVENPSELFLAERPVGAPGSVVVASAEGSRPILVEVQALVAPPAAGVGRRTSAGVDGNRLSLIAAVLAQRAGCDVLTQDIFLNVAGGVRLSEPAVDLGVACAVASSARGRAVDARTAVFGEVGLAGEIRAVTLPELRLAEAGKLGFSRCLLPKQNYQRLDARVAGDLELVPIDHLERALDLM